MHYLLKNVLFVALVTALLLVVSEPVEAQDIRSKYGISYSPLEEIVPGGNLPEGLPVNEANNNLDIVEYQGKFFFAFRTAVTHFASRGVKLIVLSSTDRKNWEVERIIHKGRDMREPRFLVYKDKLFFYFFTAGKLPWTFTPQHIWASEYLGPAEWTEPKKIWKHGYVVWRAKVHDGVALMTVYKGSHAYDADEGFNVRVSLLKSEDGLNWELYDPEKPVLVQGGEAAFEFDEAGNLYSVVRDESGLSNICKASPSNLADWQCKNTVKKYDSSLMFRHNNELYLVARRNIAGDYVVDAWFVPESLKSLYYLARYWVTKKRTALYKLDKEKMEIEWLFDFPSKGDTSFPGLVPLNEKQYLLYNYSSPIDGPDWYWVGGQLTGTRIYSTVITFDE